jgi:hypothetical protein
VRKLLLVASVVAIGCSSTPSDPSYQGDDLDCADIGHPVEVSGSDPHGLDADGDGVGCESW